MRLAGSSVPRIALCVSCFRLRTPFRGVLLVALFFASLMIGAGAVLAGHVPQASAATPLTLSTEDGLTLLGQTATITVKGPFAGGLTNVVAVVRLNGPGRPSVAGRTWPQAAIFTDPLGDLTGKDSVTITIPGDLPAVTGGYLVTVELHPAGSTADVVDSTVLASAQVWIGKVKTPATSVDVAFVWPAALGIHRGADGVFFDQALEKATEPAAESPGSLSALSALGGEFPEWHFTLAVEPVLLTQLRSMAAGYTRLDASGNKQEVKPGDAAARNAGQALAALKGLASQSGVEIDAAPYASPLLGMLAKEKWLDGFQQVQLGKQEIQDSLGLATTPVGGYPSDLDVTTDGLASFAQASIEYAVVDQQLKDDLTEPLPAGSSTVRVRDLQNNRLTLALASSELRADMRPPWDVNVFFAGLAASLAAGKGSPLVITPGGDFSIPPVVYLRAIGTALRRLGWVNTLTLGDFVKAHSPGTRPIFLNRYTSQVAGYLGESLLESLRTAHGVVSDLAQSSDATHTPVAQAQLLLYAGESRFWFMPDAGPRLASVGLGYAQAAQKLATGELDKVKFAGVGPMLVWGSTTHLQLPVENKAGYPLKVLVVLEGSGVSFPQGPRFQVVLPAGRTVVPVEVKSSTGSARVTATMTAGATLLDRENASIRFVTLTTVLPWAVLAVVVLAGLVLALLWRRRRRKRKDTP